ncbi:MAG: extracellular solute-binding protein [Lachnospiraceae bacterium]|nr:extracellular solute-binding protein [Lachnospiraceae bacterium]MCM1238201.1 extracellular solute-binding protein [Lachnospiraceae bacterium]
MKRKRTCSLILGMSLFLAACGADVGGESSTADSVSRYTDNVQAAEGAAGDSAGSLGSSTADAGGGSQPNIMENPAYSALGRQVLSAVVVVPFRETTDRIVAYNASNPDFFIEMKTYGGGIGSTAAVNLETQLSLEVLSGEGPDLVIWNRELYTPSLASEKLMENLYDFMDADSDFHREDYYENILEAFERNGGLYVLPTSFSVETGVVLADELEAGRGTTESWTLGEMLEAYRNSSHAERFEDNYIRDYELRFISQDCMGNFVDWDNGECHFDTPEFVELLEWCATLPEQFHEPENYSIPEYYREGRSFWHSVSLTTPWELAFWEAAYGGVDLLWPGHPVADGEEGLGGGMALPWDEGFSICKNSSNKEAAWECVKSFLTADMQREVQAIPLLRSVSEEKIQDALTVEYETVDGVKQEKIKFEEGICITEAEVVTFAFSSITEEDAETYRSLIENTHRSSGKDIGILDIIMEEAGAYFNGDKDAATVADIIQNRASIYVGERMKCVKKF